MPLPDRILDKFDYTLTCWNWTAYRNEDGYGIVRWKGKVRGVHRVMYEEMVGPIADGLEIDHLCGNRACGNPEHLEPVNHQENVTRGHRPNKTHCRNGHPWTPENIKITRRSRNDPRLRRDCLICLTSRNRRNAMNHYYRTRDMAIGAR